jgi:phosphoketolase
MAECMLGETSDVSRVFFPADYNTSAILIREVYQTQGQIWTIVASKRKIPDLFTKEEAEKLYAEGGIALDWAGHNQGEAKVALVAIGAYQLVEILRASARLQEKNIAHTVSYIQEPGRFRAPRNVGEAQMSAPPEVRERVLPPATEHVVAAVHTRPELLVGMLQPFIGKRNFAAMGFINQGGTLDMNGLLFINKSSWAHILAQTAEFLQIDPAMLLSSEERDALAGKRTPDGVIREIVEI